MIAEIVAFWLVGSRHSPDRRDFSVHLCDSTGVAQIAESGVFDKYLFLLVGVRGFEPPTPASRSLCRTHFLPVNH